MKVGLLSQIQGRTKVLSVVGLASLVIVSAAIQNNSIKSQKLSALKGGLQTCFTRLHNSYTARLLGADSEYLTNGFTQTTEECLGETIHAYETLGLDNTVVLDDLNTLANDANWFHQKITAQESQGLFEGNPENVLLGALGSRFEKLELKKIQINDAIHSLHNALNSRKGTMSTFFYVIAGFVPLFLGLDYLRRRSDEEALEEVLEESNRLLSEDSVSMTTIKPLIIKALNLMGLGKLGQLFEVAYFRHQSETKVDSAAGIQVPVEQGKFAREEQIEEMWTRPGASGESTNESRSKNKRNRKQNRKQNRKTENLNASAQTASVPETKEELRPQKKHLGAEVELEDRIATVIDLISSKIFTLGINLDIDSEDIKVYAEEEALDQVIYHLLTNAIDNYDFEDPKKYLSINTRVLGSTVLFDVFDSGREFSKEFLRQTKGLSTGILEHTDLAIAQSLVKDMGAKISFENVGNEDGGHVGRKIQIVLTAVESSNKKKKVTRVEKGTKKEILERMNS